MGVGLLHHIITGISPLNNGQEQSSSDTISFDNKLDQSVSYCLITNVNTTHPVTTCEYCITDHITF